MARNKYKVAVEGYVQDHIVSYYELPFENDVLKPGDKVKIKNVRGTFIFLKMVHNEHLNVQWIDCRNVVTGEFKSFYVHSIKKIIRPKKSRMKKIAN